MALVVLVVLLTALRHLVFMFYVVTILRMRWMTREQQRHSQQYYTRINE